jgi:hypothetical protein
MPSVRLFNALLTNETVRQQLSNVNGIIPAVITIDSVEQWINSKANGQTLKIYNPKLFNNLYTDYQGVDQEYLGSNKVLLLPSGEIGKTVLAPTPAELEKRDRSELKVVTTDDRIAIHSVETTNEPFTYDTVVSASFAPTGEGMDRVFTLTVAEVN